MATIALLLLVAILPLCTGRFSTTLTLERVVPLKTPGNLTELVALDRVRHIGMMWPSSGVANFSFGVIRDNPTAVGIYYTIVRLGTPPKEFHVIADTGSDISWVSCTSRIIRNITYDPTSSSSSSFVTCGKGCKSGRKDYSFCSADDNRCHFSVTYLDTSESTGFYVNDTLSYDSVLGTKKLQSTAPFIFGCSTRISQAMQKIPLGGLLGLGRQSISFTSQLASQGVAPMAFSHCLSGEGNGGGSLVLGEAVDPNMVYSPIIHSELHYTLKVEFVSVNGRKLNIRPSVFSDTINKGATFDSGTTYGYLPTEAYNAFVEAVDAIASLNAQVMSYMDFHCYRMTSSNVTSIFPQVSFTFEGGAALTIGPLDYLVQQGLMGGATMWCFAFHKYDRVAVLGDIVLRNKIIVYDLAGQRIGWTNYNCSAPLNISTEVRKRSDATRFRPDTGYILLGRIVIVLFSIILSRVDMYS